MKTLETLDGFIAYCKETSPDDWQINTVRNSDNTKNCCMGHLVNWYYGPDYQGTVSELWDNFEEIWATTYMIYPVNDGENPKYQQKNARDRVVAYLENLNAGKEKNTQQLINEQMNRKICGSPKCDNELKKGSGLRNQTRTYCSAKCARNAFGRFKI